MHVSWMLCAFLWTLLTVSQVWAKDDNSTTQQALPIKQSANGTAVAENKIDVLKSAVCLKCACDTNVRLLDCSDRNLTTWFDDSEWATLQHGDISFDTIKLERNLLTSVPQLPNYPVQRLYLGYNKIAEIALSAFQNLTELKTLDLSHNQLTSKALVPDVFKGPYSPNSFQALNKLRELNLGYNKLHNLNSDLFEHTPQLEVLVVGGNTFQVIDRLTETAIAGLASLKTLDMSYMEIVELPDFFLHGPRDLETLILSGNLFDELPDDLEYAPNLKQLVLDENPVGDIVGENIFHELPNLEYLSISYMPNMKYIGEGAFSSMPKLKTLIASNNPWLAHIDEKAFAIPTNVTGVYQYPPLEQLYLHNNNLSTVNHNWLLRWDLLNVIDLRFNPWICDCTNIWLVHTLINQINDTTPHIADGVECASPAAWRSISLLWLSESGKQFVCNSNHPERDSQLVVTLFVCVLVGLPLTFIGIFIYRRYRINGFWYRSINTPLIY